MSILNRIKNLFIISAPDEKPQKSSTALYNKVEIRQFMRRRLDIDQWRSALVAAENIYNPNRVPLYEIYNEIILDAHLSAVMEKRIRAIRNRTVQFIKKNGKPDPAISELISQPWFFDFLGYCMEAIFWGHSLIEITPKKDGSLAAILLPRQNVMPEKGIITVNPYGGKADNQINYRQPPYTSYIIEVGDGKNLGILAKAAPIVIYKRFNMADWSTRNELFGMPMREIRYDPNMPHSKTQAEAAVREMGAAGYIVLPEGAQLILHHQNGSAGADTYALLDENLDKKLSKLVLGNTMTTEDGSSLAQAKVHADVEHEMNMADQVFVEYILNYQLKNLLAAQGFPTDKGYFKFDDTERLPMKDRYLIDTALAQTIPIDPDYFYQTYGVPPPKDKTPNKDLSLAVKKKDSQCCAPSPYEQVNLAYNQDDSTLSPLPNEYLQNIEKIADQLIQELHTNPNMPPSVTADLQQETGAALVQALRQGYGKGFSEVDYDSPDNEMIAYLQNNMFTFSAAKTFAQIQEMQKILTDPKTGKPVSFAKFKEEALKLHQQYNLVYMQAEYNHAIAAAQMAANWLRIQEDAEDFPYLQYTTADDARVRAEHAALDGIVLPVNSGFWNTYYPPNGWNCRCDVIQLTQDQANKKRVADEKTAFNAAGAAVQQKLFRGNVGKSKIIYHNNHPYFVVLGKNPTELSAIKNYGMKTVEQIYENRQSHPELKADILSYEDMLRWWDSQPKDNDGEMALHTPIGKVVITDALISHMGNKKHLKEKRFRILNDALATLIEPSEIWTHLHENKRGSGKTLTTMFVRYYNQAIVVVAADIEGSKSTIKTFYELREIKEENLAQVRKGILIKR